MKATTFMRRFFFLSILLLSVCAISCKKDIIPPPPDEIQPGGRDYTWTADTLKLPPWDLFTATRMWGSGPNDVWITGFGDAGDLLWHFDGVRWTRDSTRYLIRPSAIWGTAGNNIWLGNIDGTFWHYDGMQWSKFSGHSVSGYNTVVINNIWGITPDNLFAVGAADRATDGSNKYKGVVMHFNGGQWDFIQIPDIRVGFVDTRQQFSSGLLFLEGTRFESTGDTSKLYVYDGQTLNEVYSSASAYASVNEMKGEVYLAIGKKIYKHQNGELKVWKDLSNTLYLSGGSILGRSEKDFFAFNDGLGILHYNGSNIEIVFTTKLLVFASQIFPKDVFLFVKISQTAITSFPQDTMLSSMEN